MSHSKSCHMYKFIIINLSIHGRLDSNNARYPATKWDKVKGSEQQTFGSRSSVACIDRAIVVRVLFDAILVRVLFDREGKGVSHERMLQG